MSQRFGPNGRLHGRERPKTWGPEKGRLVRSSLSLDDYRRAYELMDTPPLDYDCGRLCERLCCQEYEPGVGMYLLPGEECMFTGSEPWLRWYYHSAKHHDFPPEWDGLVAFVMCRSTCPRERRPIQCRTFPLMPYLDRAGDLQVCLDDLSGYFLCPLVRSPRKFPLRPQFHDRVLQAWRILVKDPLVRADVAMQSRKLDQDRQAPWRRLQMR